MVGMLAGKLDQLNANCAFEYVTRESNCKVHAALRMDMGFDFRGFEGWNLPT